MIVGNQSLLKLKHATPITLRRKDPWEGELIHPKVMEVIKKRRFVYEALLIIREKCGMVEVCHALKVAGSMPDVAGKIHLSFQEEESLISSGLTHDVGRAFAGENFSQKLNGLSPTERESMRKHPKASFEFLMDSGAVDEAMICVRHHQHKGYPRSGAERRRVRKIIFRERRKKGCYDRREDSLWHDKMSRLLSIVDIFKSMEGGCHNSRPYIMCKDPRENTRDRCKELACFSSPTEVIVINLLMKRSLKLLVTTKK